MTSKDTKLNEELTKMIPEICDFAPSSLDTWPLEANVEKLTDLRDFMQEPLETLDRNLGDRSCLPTYNGLTKSSCNLVPYHHLQHLRWCSSQSFHLLWRPKHRSPTFPTLPTQIATPEDNAPQALMLEITTTKYRPDGVSKKEESLHIDESTFANIKIWTTLGETFGRNCSKNKRRCSLNITNLILNAHFFECYF